MLHIDPAVKLRNELLARGNSPLNMREIYLALLLISQSLRCSYDILDLGLIVSQRDGSYATRVSCLSAIELATD